jgi:hypothetical protein
MRKSMLMAGLLAAALAGTGGVAHAQQPPGNSPGAPPPPPGTSMMNGTMEMGPGPHHPPPNGMGMMNPMMMGGPAAGREMEEGMMMRMHPPKGAVFMFHDGDQHVLIKCADDESTKACVDGATTLMDKLDAAADSGGSGTQGQGSQGQGNTTH